LLEDAGGGAPDGVCPRAAATPGENRARQAGGRPLLLEPRPVDARTVLRGERLRRASARRTLVLWAPERGAARGDLGGLARGGLRLRSGRRSLLLGAPSGGARRRRCPRAVARGDEGRVHS